MTLSLLVDKKAMERKRVEDSKKFQKTKKKYIWPWQLEGYCFDNIPYREGLQKDQDDWRVEDQQTDFTSNI